MDLVLIKRRLAKIILTTVLSLIAMNTLIAKEVSWSGDKEQDQILANIKKSDVLSEQKKLGKEVLEKANQESKQYKGLGQLEKFDKSDTLEHEKLADQIFKKVKKDKPEYEKAVRNIDTKKEENWAKGFAKEAEAKIYKYSQTELENKESTAVSQINDTDKYLSYFNKILQESKKDAKIRDGLYIAVSLSMPKETLVELYKWAEKYGGKLIFRGLKNNSFLETFSAVKALSDIGVKVDINPKIFRSYGIEQVPAFLLIDGGRVDIMRGNVSVKYALEEFKSKGTLKKEAALCLEKVQR